MASQQMTAVAQVFDTIQRPEFQARLRDVLPAGVPVQRFTAVCKTAIQLNQDLLTKADRQSLYMAITRCAQDGLRPDGREAALVIMGGKAAYLPMIGGLRKIAAKYGVRIASAVVYAADEFIYSLGVTPEKRHTAPPLGTERGAPIGAWAEAIDKDGSIYLEVMSFAEIEKTRAVSRAANSGPWVAQWGEMARKTVARRLFKSLPLYDMDEVDARILQASDSEYERDDERDAKPQPMIRDAHNRPAALAIVAGTVDDDPVDDSALAAAGIEPEA